MSITTFCGPMFSGKSSSMTIHLENASRVRGNRCVFICSIKDSRGGDDHISIHNKHFKGQQAFQNVDYIKAEKLTESLLEKYNVLFIDEAQFFDNLYEWAKMAKETYHRKLYLSGIVTKFDRSIFSIELAKVLCISTTIVQLKGGCDECARNGVDAVGEYSKRMVPSTEDILIGRSGVYECWCLDCHMLCEWEYSVSRLSKYIKAGVFKRGVPRHKVVLETTMPLYDIMKVVTDMKDELYRTPKFVSLEIKYKPSNDSSCHKGNYPLYDRTDIVYKGFSFKT